MTIWPLTYHECTLDQRVRVPSSRLLRMTTTEFLIAVFALLSGGLLLPLSSGLRAALFLLLIALSVLTFLGGGMQYIASLF
jgi:hypothetical protein